MRLVLLKDQRINDTDSLPPGTHIASIEFNPDLPGGFQSIQFLASAIASGRMGDEQALPKQQPIEEVPAFPAIPDVADEA